MERRGTLGDEPSFETRYMPDHELLRAWCELMRQLGQRVVLTMGSFDLIHIGHARYLQEARSKGHVLVVGVDNDDKIRKRKGPGRPVVPEGERVEFLVFLRAVDVVTLKRPDEPMWNLIDVVRPDTVISTADTYTPKQIEQIEERFGTQVMVLPRMASTSTSERVRQQQLSLAGRLREAITDGFGDFTDQVIAQVLDGTGSTEPTKKEGYSTK